MLGSILVEVSDRRGSGGLPSGMMLGGGGGIVGLIIVLVVVFGGFGGGSGNWLRRELARQRRPRIDLARPAADANRRTDCRVVGVVNSVQEFWNQTLDGYEPADTVLFTGQTSTGCGAASSDVGPFYCPADGQVYIDLGFYAELHDRFGARWRSVRGGLRDRARVRPPRARSARHDRGFGWR